MTRPLDSSDLTPLARRPLEQRRIVRAVTFDFGETLTTLDPELLVAKLDRLGLHASSERLLAGLPRAWESYQLHGHPGDAEDGGGQHPWKPLMTEMLTRGGVALGAREREVVDALFEDQKRANLWRKPIAGMIELVRELRSRGVPVGILSNSEGRLTELIDELEWTSDLPTVVDSGVVGTAKPDPAIFHLAAKALEVDIEDIVHVGDSLRADVEGARAAGAAAVWFTSPPAYPSGHRTGPPGVEVCSNASELRHCLLSMLGASLDDGCRPPP